jgi:hypothetical protein
MHRHKFQCVDCITEVAIRLGDIVNEVVFVGGAVSGLLITDPAVSSMRPTLDVDVIIEVTTQQEYYKFQERLKERGFSIALDETIICRFRNGPIILDVMPADENILGFTNKWYAGCVQHSQYMTLNGVRFRVVTPEYFLATKLEAFHGRGNRDYVISHDMEDIIAVIDGRSEIVQEIMNADKEVRAYLVAEFNSLIADDDFMDALPGHLRPDSASQMRLPILIKRIKQLAGNSS